MAVVNQSKFMSPKCVKRRGTGISLVAEWGFFAWVRLGVHTMFYW